MFMARNGMILGTTDTMTFRSLIDTRKIVAIDYSGPKNLVGDGLELSTDEVEWSDELWYDFGPENIVTEFEFWVRPKGASLISTVSVVSAEN